jgi:hypothetical protein
LQRSAFSERANGPEERAAVAVPDVEHDNFRPALEAATTRGLDADAVAIASGLAKRCELLGHWGEGVKLLDALLDHDLDAVGRGRLLGLDLRPYARFVRVTRPRSLRM